MRIWAKAVLAWSHSHITLEENLPGESSRRSKASNAVPDVQLGLYRRKQQPPESQAYAKLLNFTVV